MNLTHSSEDANALIEQNNELSEALTIMQEEVTYLKLREKKIMYLVHVMQGKGYPVTQIFEQ
jgi:ABC-type transport system substrate-binding protein